MEWGLPPERAGCAPQASRHSSRAEAVLEVGEREVMGTGDGLVVWLAPVADVAAGFGVEGGLVPVADAETEPTRALVEQALIIDARPTLPASRSS